MTNRIPFRAELVGSSAFASVSILFFPPDRHLWSLAKQRIRFLWVLLFFLTLTCGIPGQAIAGGSNALDRIDFGNANSEQSHSFDVGFPSLPLAGTGALGQTFRQPLTGQTANGAPAGPGNGELAFTMTVDPAKQNYLTIRVWGGDNNGIATLLQQSLKAGAITPLDLGSAPSAFPNRFYYSTIPIDIALTQGKTSLQLVLYPSGNGGRPVYSAYTHTDPHFIPDGSDPTGSQPAITGQLPTSNPLTLSQVTSLLQTNRQSIYGSGGYYNSILARQVTPGTSGAPTEVIGLDMYQPVSGFTGTTPDQWRDACGSGQHGPGYSTIPDEMLTVLTSTYLLPPFTDANGNTVSGLDHYHDASIIQRIVNCLDGASYLQASSGGYQNLPYNCWEGLTSTPRASGHNYAGVTTRGQGWSLTLEGADTDCLGRTILLLLNDPTAAPIFQSYLSQSYDADLNGGSMLRANAYERMLNNDLNYTYSIFFCGTIAQGMMSTNSTYINTVALAKLQSLYPYSVSNTNFPAGTVDTTTTYNFPYPGVSGSLGVQLLEQITGATAATPLMTSLYTTYATDYAISASGFGEAHGSLSGGYDGRYGTILPWLAANMATFAAYDSNASGTPLSLVQTQARRAADGYLHFISPLENFNGLNDNFTLAQEDFITYRDPYAPNSDCGGFNVGTGYPAADPNLGINSALELRGAYLEAVYGHIPGVGKGGNNQLECLETLGSYENTLRSLVNVNPSSLTMLPGEPGAGNSAYVDFQTGSTAIYFNGERLYMGNNYRNYEYNNNTFGVASNISVIHDTTSTVDRAAQTIMPHDNTTVQSDGNLCGAVAQPWVMRYGNWLVAGNPTSSSSTVTLPSGNGQALDLVSNTKYSMGSTVTVPALGSVAINMPIPTTAQLLASGTYTLTNLASQLLLDCPNGATTSGLQIDQASPPSGINSQWIFTYVSSGNYTVKNVASGLYLTSSGGTGSALVQQPADQQQDQLWQLIASGDGYVVVNQASGLAVNDPGGSTNPGTGMVVWSQDAGLNSVWKIQPLPAGPTFANGNYTLTSVQCQLLIDDAGASTTSGQAMTQQVANGGADQQWTLTYAGNGYYTIRNVASGLYLAPADKAAAFYYPNLVQQTGSAGSAWQLWKFLPNSAGYSIMNQATGQVFQNQGGSPGPAVIMYDTYNQGSQNTWLVQPTGVSAPATPTGVNAAGGNGVVTINWNTVAGAAGYDVLRSTSSGSGFTPVAYSVTGTSYADTGVTNGTTYYYEVVAVDSGGASAASSPTTATPLAPPSNVVATANNGSITLTWTTTTGATSFNIKRAVTSGGPYITIATGVTGTSYTDNTATNGTTYYYVVSAVDSTSVSAGPSLANAGFETPSVGTYQYNPSGGSWTFTAQSGSSGSGIAANGSGFTSSNPNAPEGTQVAFLQSTGTISQSVAGLIPGGTYSVSFYAAQRASNSGGQTWNVTMNGTTVASYAPAQSATSYVPYSAQFTATASTETLAFVGTDTNGGDNTIFIDNVSINVINAGPSLANAGFETPSVGTYQYNPSGGSWTFTAQSGSSGSGIAANGSGFTSSNPNAPEGTQVAFLQSTGTISQSVAGLIPGGTYSVSFYAAQRASYNNGGQTWNVTMNGTTVASYAPAQSATSYVPYSASFTATAATETLAFIGTDTNGGDNTILLDNISIIGGDESVNSAEATAVPGSVQSLANAGFETPSVGTYQYNPSGASWTFTAQSGTNGSGIAANGSAFTSSNPNAPQGVQVAFLQGTGSASQSVSGLTSGTSYVVNFSAAQRANGTAGGQTWNVTMNGTTVASYAPAQSATSYVPYSASFTATAATETLAFVGTNTHGGDNTIFIDNVSISIPGVPVITSALSTSATINSAVSYQLTASNSPTSYAASGLPGGLSINTSTGLISGTPNATGTFSAAVSATNAKGAGSATLVFTINPVVSVPVITSATTATGSVGVAFSYQITASGNPVSYAATNLYQPGLTINTSTGLISGKPNTPGTYTCNLSAANSAGTGTATLTLTVSAVPLPPTGLTATPGYSQATLGWSGVSNATSYNVKRATTSGGPYSTVGSTSGNSFVDKSLTNGTTYYYVVTASNAAGESANSTQVSVTPAAQSPSVPTNLTAVASNDNVILTWSQANYANSYNVKRATSSGGSYTTLATGVTATTYTDLAVPASAAGITYYYVVSAVNPVGESANSSPASVTVLSSPSVPTGVTLNSVGNTQAILGWTAATSASSYSVLRSLSSGGSYSTIATQITGTSYTDSTLSPGSNYYYVIQASNAQGTSGNSSEVELVDGLFDVTGFTPTTDLLTLAQSGILEIDESTGTYASSVVRSSSLKINGGQGFSVGSTSNEPANFLGIGSSGGNTNDSFGPLTLSSGALFGKLTPNSAKNEVVTFASLTRNLGTGLIFGHSSNFGTGVGSKTLSSATANSANVVFTTAPTSLLVGGTGAAGTSTIKILPFAVVNSLLATYDTTSGLRPLASAETTTTLTSGSSVTNNVKVSSAKSITSATTVNSVYLTTGGSITGTGGTLTITSGALVADQTATVSVGTLAFGSAEGFLYVGDSRTLTINSVITGSNSLTACLEDYSGTTARLVLGGANTFTGTTTLTGNNAGLAVVLTNGLALQKSTLDYNNYGASLQFGTGSSNVTSATFGGLKGLQNLALTNSGTGGGGVALTIGGDNDSTSYGGILSGAGSLTKTGTGTLTMLGANTYSGATAITAGAFMLNGSLGSSSAVSVSSGTTFGGAGTVGGSLNVANGGVLAPGSGSGMIGTLTVSNGLTLQGGSTLNFDLGAPAASDKIVMSGTYTGPSSGTVTINCNAFAGFGVGTYNLITGAAGINTASFVRGTVPSGYNYAFSVSNGTLSLQVSAPLPPANLTATAGNAQVVLNWNASTGASSYTVSRATVNGGPYTVIASGITGTTYTNTGLTNGTTYYYVVQGVNLGGPGAYSSQASAIPGGSAGSQGGSAPSAYQQWLVANNLPADTDGTATPDNDGVCLLLKFATGLPVGTPAVNPLTESKTDSDIILQFNRLSPATVTYIVEYSSDLATWTTLTSLGSGATAWSDPSVVSETGTGSLVQVTVVVPISVENTFFRLRVTNP